MHRPDDRLVAGSSTSRVLPAENHGEIGRSPFERDADRLRYTRYFRRLKDVTQVARAGESYLYHDRLSHSLKVAQVGAGLAKLLLRREIINSASSSSLNSTHGKLHTISKKLAKGKGNHHIDISLYEQLNPSLVEAACLAHDMGHPPFGHLAEKKLDRRVALKTNEYFDPEQDGPDCDLNVGTLETDKALVGDDLNAIDRAFRKLTESGHRIEFKHGSFDYNSTDELPGIRFEGNAQSFRIVTRLASHYTSEAGLALTMGTLNGVLKYPYGRGEHASRTNRKPGKFGYYKTEESCFNAVRQHTDRDGEQTLTAEIMDYADDVTYAIHDLTDFYKDGRVPLHELLRASYNPRRTSEVEELERLTDFLEDQGVIESRGEPQDLFSRIAFVADTYGLDLFERYRGRKEQRESLGYITSYLIDWYLNAQDLTNPEYVFLDDSGSEYRLHVDGEIEREVEILQKTTEYYVLRDSALMAQQRGQAKLIGELFDILYEQESSGSLDFSSIPKPYQSWLEQTATEVGSFRNSNERRARIVADFIAGLTEPQAVDLYERLTGANPGSLQDEITR